MTSDRSLFTPGNVRLTIAVKSVLTVCLLIAFSLTMVGVYLERRERQGAIEQVVARLEAQASLLAAEVPEGIVLGDAWARRAAARTKARSTVIAADGRVLADSEEPSRLLANHGNRPEVTEALRSGSGRAVRFSQTVSRTLVYFARSVPTAAGAPFVLRLSVPLEATSQVSGSFRRDFLGIAAVSLVVALLIAALWARGIARQLRRMIGFARSVSQGAMPGRLPVASRDELADLAAALNAMAADLKDTVQRLEAEGRRSRTIMESMGEGLLVLDAHGKISLLNPAAEKLLCLDARAALGQTPLEVIRSHELDDLVRTAAAADAGTGAEITLVYPRRRTLAGTAVAMRDAHGANQGTVVALRDVTQVKRLEEIRMEFVLNVSHELRTPLTAIRGYAETLLGGGLTDGENAKKFLEIIHRHSERLGRLLNDLLELSNIELQRTALHLRAVPCADAARQSTALLAPQAEAKSIRLVAAVSEDVPPVLADRDRLVQILVNLVDNAVKYTPHGGKVTVAARRLTAGTRGRAGAGEAGPPLPVVPAGLSDAVEFSVTDTGIGIPEKDLPRLTERFYRVDKARSREMGGTGLGLAIVKHLVAAHNGTLSIESTLGEGTQVRVLLPAAPTPPSTSS
jgi:two-component system, OmpR family, phosphate regulon sensor histidine kinase PhoR